MRLLLLLLCAVATWPLQAMASAPRSKRVAPTSQPQLLLPAGAAPQELYSAVAIAPDLSRLTPPGWELRMVEDEPYVYSQGPGLRAMPHATSGHCAVNLVAVQQGDKAGAYRARVLLRWEALSGRPSLLQTFDLAAHAASVRSALSEEFRDQSGHRIAEMRSPLGLLAELGLPSPQREYLYYEAEVMFEELGAAQFQTARFHETSGELMLAWQDSLGSWMLNIAFEASGANYALPLTLNLGRAVLQRQSGGTESGSFSFEPYSAYGALGRQAADAKNATFGEIADLAEQPGRGTLPPLLNTPLRLRSPASRSGSSFLRTEPQNSGQEHGRKLRAAQAVSTATPVSLVDCQAVSCKPPSSLQRTAHRPRLRQPIGQEAARVVKAKRPVPSS